MTESAGTQKIQGVIDGSYRDNLRMIRSAAHGGESEDVKIHEFELLGRPAAIIYIDGMANDAKLQQFLLTPCLVASPLPEGMEMEEYLLKKVLPLGSAGATAQLSVLLSRVFSGDAALICDGMPGAILADVKGFSKRALNQPINETVILGPHEAFGETLRDNVVLIRRLLPSPQLISESMTVGNAAPTRLCLMYIDGVARRETVEEVRRRLRGCNVDYVSSAGMLEQLLEDRPFSLLPQMVSTERPDRAVSFLNEGQVLIAMENSPLVLAVPIGFLHLYHAPDDTALRWQYGTFLRLLRMSGVLIALLLPPLFVSLTIFHPEGMPLSLMTSVMETQARVPLSLFSSMLLMLLIFSLINEAGVRVPGAMGGSLSIVSGLILGQAAVQADLFSPLVIIVVALSGLGSYAVPTYSLTLSIRIAQLLLVLFSGMAGYLGMILGLFLLLTRLSGLRSMNQPYFAPYAPRRPANPDGFLRLPIWRQRLRGGMSNPCEMEKTRGPMRAWARDGEEK